MSPGRPGRPPTAPASPPASPASAGSRDDEANEAVGRRIAKARDFLGLTQAVVAQKLGLARTTQVAIEQGRRPVSVAELYRYAEVLSRPLDYFLGLGVWGRADFRPAFQVMAEKLDGAAAFPPRRPGRPRGAPEASPEKLALMTFETLCRNYLELEEKNALPRAPMPELPLPRSFAAAEAEQLASAVRSRLDLGPDAPAGDLRSRLEQAFALRAYVLGRGTQLAAAAFHHPSIGASVLLSEQPPPRMLFALAFSLGHLLGNREDAVLEVTGDRRRTGLAGFAAAFASALLLPARGLRERFAAVHAETSETSDVAVVHLARSFGVTTRVLRARLEALRLVPASALRRIDEALRDAASPPAADAGGAWEPLPERYLFLAVRAFRRGLVDRGRLAECLLATEGEAAALVGRYLAGAGRGEGVLTRERP